MSRPHTVPAAVMAWHFVCEDRTLRDGHTVEPGYVYSVDPDEVVMCSWGLHASIRPLDALMYAPGPVVCRVRCGGLVIHAADKLVCSEREVVWMADATETLKAFARWCALQVIDKWAAPDVVRRYLETGDEAIWADAWAAAAADASDAQSTKLTEMLEALHV